MLNRIFIIVCAFGLLSCTAFLKQKYGLERKFRFQSRNDFIQCIEKEKTLPLNHILYIDSLSAEDFFRDNLQQSNSLLFLGMYLNDSIQIKKSDYFLENPECIGRIENEVILNLFRNEFPDSLKVKTKNISAYVLHFLKDDSSYVFSNSTKKMKLFLIHSFSMGRYYDSLYNRLFQLERKYSDVLEICIINIDPVQQLKKFN